MDNIEESANVQNEKVRMESTGRNSFSSSAGQPPSKKSLELENENLNQLPYTTRAIEFHLCNNRLGTQLPIIRAEFKRLQVESKELKAQLLSKKNAENDFRKKISEMEEQLEHQRNLFGAEPNERETMVKEKDKKIMELEAQLREKSNIETSLQTKINAFQIAKEVQRISKLEKENEELKQTLTDVQKSLTNSQDTNEIDKLEKAKLQVEISERDKTIEDLKEVAKNAEKRHEKENEELQAEIRRLKNADAEKHKRIQLKNSDAEKRKLIDQEKKIAELEKEAKSQEIEQLNQTIFDVQKSLDESAAEKTQMENDIAELLIKLNVLQEENNQLKNEIASLQSNNGNSIDSGEMESESQEKENPVLELQATKVKSNTPFDFFPVKVYLNTPVSDRKDKFSNRILLIMDLYYNGEKWLVKKNGFEIPLGDSDCKIYVQKYFEIESLPAAKFSSLIDRLHSNSFMQLYLKDLTMSFNDYKNLVAKGKIENLDIQCITVRNAGGALITADQLLKEVPNVKLFSYFFNDGEKMDGISQKFVQLPRLPNLRCFSLWNIQEGFNLKTFGQFIKSNANQNSFWSLYFKVSKETFAEIQRIHKEIVSTLPSSFRLEISN